MFTVEWSGSDGDGGDGNVVVVVFGEIGGPITVSRDFLGTCWAQHWRTGKALARYYHALTRYWQVLIRFNHALTLYCHALRPYWLSSGPDLH